MQILVVCLGNICRSPTGEAALRRAAGQRSVPLHVESAGTAAYHVGNPPDRRMVTAAAAMGLEIGGTARQARPEDFDRFDLILAMDRTNFADLEELAPSPDAAAKIRMFRDFDTLALGADMPDPYYGGESGFREVVAIAQRTAAGVVSAVLEERL